MACCCFVDLGCWSKMFLSYQVVRTVLVVVYSLVAVCFITSSLFSVLVYQNKIHSSSSLYRPFHLGLGDPSLPLTQYTYPTTLHSLSPFYFSVSHYLDTLCVCVCISISAIIHTLSRLISSFFIFFLFLS
jgi:hypothetical protein